MSTIPRITLNDGHTIPQLGFGTYQIDPSETESAVSEAIKIGYRHFDTAEMYGNEAGVGAAIRASGIDRSEFFVTSKLNNGYHDPEAAKKAFAETLKQLDIGYLDLFLIHWPLPTKYDGDFISTWETLEELQETGKVKSIGVSNFQVDHLEQLLRDTETTPAVNQIEVHPYFPNKTVSDYDELYEIATEAWSPIAQGDVLDDPIVVAIAEELKKTAAQVVLRWHIQHGYIVFPKTVTPARMRENFEIFDFKLAANHMTALDNLDKGESGRTGPNPDTFDYIP